MGHVLPVMQHFESPNTFKTENLDYKKEFLLNYFFFSNQILFPSFSFIQSSLLLIYKQNGNCRFLSTEKANEKLRWITYFAPSSTQMKPSQPHELTIKFSKKQCFQKGQAVENILCTPVKYKSTRFYIILAILGVTHVKHELRQETTNTRIKFFKAISSIVKS